MILNAEPTRNRSNHIENSYFEVHVSDVYDAFVIVLWILSRLHVSLCKVDVFIKLVLTTGLQQQRLFLLLDYRNNCLTAVDAYRLNDVLSICQYLLVR